MKRRSKKTVGKIVFAAVFIGVAVLAAYLVTRPIPKTPLPAYLDRCMPTTGDFAYDSRPQLAITINGGGQTIPAGIGIIGGCVRPIFTLGATGTIHIQTDVNRTYTLGDFFLVWGNTYGAEYGTFNQNQIFTYRKDASHDLTMQVFHLGPALPDDRFQDYPFPVDANTTSNPYRIVISYG